jgi:hypothetical protein
VCNVGIFEKSIPQGREEVGCAYDSRRKALVSDITDLKPRGGILSL